VADLRGIIPPDPVKHRAPYSDPAPTPWMPGYSWQNQPDPNFGGILPSGGSFSDTQVIKDGQSGYNAFPIDPSYDAGRGGYLTGFGDPSDPNSKYTFTQFFGNTLPDKIIPGQFTQTAAQSVGPAQFFVGGQAAVSGGPGTAQTSKPFSVSQPSAAPNTKAQANAGPQGFYFGNNGSAGFLPGTFGGGPGQAAPFYQDPNTPLFKSTTTNPNPPTASPSNSGNLGVFTPVDPKIRALFQSR